MKLRYNLVVLWWVFIEWFYTRTHQHATGIKNQGIFKSIGGNSSKIYLAVDGNTIEFILDGITYNVKNDTSLFVVITDMILNNLGWK